MAELSVVGKNVLRVDALEKATGQAVYCADIKLPHMLYAKVLRSPHPHAKIVSVDTSKVEKLPGVVCVITGKDAPKRRFGQVVYDETVLAQDIVRAVGSPVAAVAAETIDAAEEALELIEVKYEQLPAIFDPEEAISTNPSVVIHPGLFSYDYSIPSLRRLDSDRPNVFMHFKIRNGDVEKGFRESDLIMENKFSTARIQHCAIEPHVVIAQPEADGGLTVWLSNQCLQDKRMDLSRLFDIKPSKVRVIQPYIGGAFGGKNGLRDEPIAILLALKTAKPVKLELTREEIFLRGGTRAQMIIDIKDGVRRDGTLLSREMRAIVCGGSSEAVVALVTRNCSFGAVGTYRIPNFKFDSYGVYLNEPVATAFRGFGSTQVIWAIESHMDMLAEKLGIDPVTIRKKNLLREGEINVTGEVTHSIGVEQCLDKVLEFIKLNEKPKVEGVWRRGKGFSIGNKYSLAPSASMARVKVMEDGNIIVYHGSSELGQGCDTVMAQIGAEEFGISVDKVKIAFSDSLYMPYDFGTVSSRVTYHMGNAVRLACQDAKRQIFERIAQGLEVDPGDLEMEAGVIYVKGVPDKKVMIVELFAGYRPGGYGLYTEGGEIMGNATYIQGFIPEDNETGQIDRKLANEGRRLNAFYSHTAKAVEVAVNVETGEVKVLRCVAADDMGQPINPKMCEQQAEGGIGMGIGGAIYEEVLLKEGIIENPSFTDYRMPSVGQMPTVDKVKTIRVPAPHKDGPFGAKGFAEGAMIGIDAAIGNAVYNAVGVRIKELPISAERVLRKIKDKEHLPSP